MRKYKNTFMLFGAVVLAAFVTILVANQITKAKQSVQEEVIEVAIAKVDLKWGTVLTKEMIDKGRFLKNSLPSQCYTDPTSLPGRVLISNVVANFPISEQSLAPVTLKTGGVSAVITPEKRAIAVKVDKIIGVSGFIHPNNRVDVLVTLKNVAGLNFPVNKTILENVLVLAVGPDIERKGKEQKPNPVDVITLEVTPEEAEKLALASQEGKISLVLRKFGDSKEVLTTGQTTAGLLNSYSSGSVLPAASKRLVPATSGVSGTSSKFISSKRNSVVTAKEKKKEEEKEKQKPIVVELIKGVKVTEVKIEGSL